MSQPSWLKRSFDALSRRKVFRAAAAYAVPAWLLVQIADTLLEAFGGDEAHMRLLILALLAGFPLVLIGAWLFDLRKGRLQRTRDGGAPASRAAQAVDLGIIAACAVAIGYFLLNTERSAPTGAPAQAVATADTDQLSVAVLPFRNNSADPANAIFADGLAEDVLIRLSKIEELRVPGRTSSFRYREDARDLAVIASALNVATVLEGSVRAYEGVIKVTASLVDTASASVLWSESYTREMTNVFTIQEDIARAVAEALKIELLGQPADLVARPTESLDAYRLYLRGRNEWHKRTSAGNAAAIDLFQRAIALDARYAEAWSGLSDAYNFASTYGNMEAADALKRSREAAERALEYDPELAEAHASFGLVLSDEGRYPEAAQAFERAIELNPGMANAHMWYGSVLSWVDAEGAVRERRIAAELEPLSPIAVQLYAESLTKVGRLDEARRELQKILDFAPEYPLVHFELANLAIARNDYTAAIGHLYKANALDPGRAFNKVMLSRMYMFLGDLRSAKEWLDRAIETGPDQQQVITHQMDMLALAGDFAAIEHIIDTRFSNDLDFSAEYQYRSLLALYREDYQGVIYWIRRTFARFNGVEVSELKDDQLMLHERTLLGLVYLANAEARSGNASTADLLAGRVLNHVSEQRARGLRTPTFLFAETGALIALDELDAALTAIRRMADEGFPAYRLLEDDPVYKPLRGELEFEAALDIMRDNAARQLAAIEQPDV